MKDIKKIEQEIKKEAKKIINDEDKITKQIEKDIKPKVENVKTKKFKTSKPPKEKKVNTPSNKKKADSMKTRRTLIRKAKRLASQARHTVEEARRKGLKFKSDYAEQLFEKRAGTKERSDEYIERYIRTEADYQKYISYIGKTALGNQMAMKITIIRHAINPDGKRLKDQDQVFGITLGELSSPTKTAKYVKRMLSYKVPVEVNGIKRMRHISSFKEARLLEDIMMLISGEPEIKPGMKNEFFEISNEWDTQKKFKDLSLYVKFKKIPTDGENEYVIALIEELSEIPFTRKELYKVYREEVMKHEAIKGWTDDEINDFGKLINDNLLWRICERDCDPSDVRPTHDYIFKASKKLHDMSQSFFDVIKNMIDNGDYAYDIKAKIDSYIIQIKNNKSNNVAGVT